MPAGVVLEKLPGTGTHVTPVTPVTGNYVRQRVYIFTTRQGLFFAGLLLIMLVGAINYNNSLAYILTFLLCSLLLVSMLHTYRNLRGLIISVQPARPVFAGEQLQLPLMFDNRGGLRRVALTVEPYAKNRKQRRARTAEQLNVNLQSGKISCEHLAIHTVRRGRLRPGRLKITSSYPLGQFRAWSYFEPDQAGIVYPRPVGSAQLPAYTEFDTEEQLGKKTGTDDFTGFKPYRLGDSIRNIDWKAFAKEQPLQVKRFSGSGSGRLLLKWDQCGTHSDTERRLSQLCLWVLIAEREGLHYGLEFPGTHIDPAHGAAHQQRCLTSLACYGLDEDKN